MSTRKFNGKIDRAMKLAGLALKEYAADHPGAEVECYRSNSVCIRIRIVDARFRKMKSMSDRHDDLWNYFDKRLPDDVMSQISLLLGLTPQEKKRDSASLYFEQKLDVEAIV